MGMRVLVVVVLAALAGPAAQARARPCPTGDSIIQQSASAVLYQGDNLVGCYRQGGRRTYISDVDGEIYASAPYRLAGRFAAAQREICVRSTGECSADLTVWDLSSPPANGFEAYSAIDGYASDVEIKSNGSYAAIVQASGSPLRRVFVHSSAERKTRRVAAGADVDPESLNRSGRMVQWLQGGVLKSARLR